MNQRATIVYVILLLILVGAYLFVKNRPESADIELPLTSEPTVEVTYLFPAEAGTPSSIRVESKAGEVVELVRDADNTWVLTQPIEAAAESGMAESAAGQLSTIRVLDRSPGVPAEIVGLEVPEYVLTIKFSSGVEQTVDIGTVTPSESGYYVRDTAGDIVIVSRSAVDILLSLLQNPPYLETLTPSPTPATPTATPAPTTPEADTTPSVTVTPSP